MPEAPVPPRIVLLDAHPLLQDDLDPSELRALGRLEVHPRSRPEEVLPRCSGARAVITNKVVLDAPTLGALREEGLAYVGITATGTNVVDLEAARRLGVTVTNVPAYATESVTQWVIAAILAHATAWREHVEATRSGGWQAAPDFSLAVAPTFEVQGKVLLVVGAGAIGRRVAEVATALGMQVLASAEQASRPDAPVRWVPLEEGLGACDVVVLTCPLTDRTARMVDPRFLARLRPHALLVNAGRGGLLDEAAVAAALHEGRLGAVAADVLEQEPPRHGSPLLGAPRCAVTPHVAWTTREARARLLAEVTKRLAAFLAGVPSGVL